MMFREQIIQPLGRGSGNDIRFPDFALHTGNKWSKHKFLDSSLLILTIFDHNSSISKLLESSSSRVLTPISTQYLCSSKRQIGE